MTGQTFGQLTAIRPVERSKGSNIIWEFKCTCGNVITRLGFAVKREANKDPTGILPSCGCKRKEMLRTRQCKHGFSRHPLQAILTCMKQRCYNPNNKDYPAYGGRGVTVYQEWLDNPKSFYKWAIDNGWYQGCHIDKDIKSMETKLYSPSTCSIVTPVENLSQPRYKPSKG